jgi:hypothetical protein
VRAPIMRAITYSHRSFFMFSPLHKSSMRCDGRKTRLGRTRSLDLQDSHPPFAVLIL